MLYKWALSDEWSYLNNSSPLLASNYDLVVLEFLKTVFPLQSGRRAIQIASDNNHTELYNFLYWQGLQRLLKTKLATFRII